MNLAKKLLMTTGDSSGGLAPSSGYVDDVFSTYVYKGNSANRSFVTGQNLLADGGMVWTKGRSGTYGATDHYLFHTERGSDIFLSTNTTNGQGAFTAGTSVSSFNNDGFSIGTSPYVNNSTTEYVSWVFKNAPKFYGHQVVTKSAGSNASVNFPELGELGMVRVKSISGTGSWYVWHRSLPSGQLLIGETTAAPAALGHVTVSGTTVTLVNSVIANGQYLVEAFAHDTSLDGIVQCGSFTGDNTYREVDLGWETQLVMIKRINASGYDFNITDTVRGMTTYPGIANRLAANVTSTELDSSYPNPIAKGFAHQLSAGTCIYLAIRRPNKPPTSGTEVFAPLLPSGATPSFITGFPVDAVIMGYRLGQTTYPWVSSRLISGGKRLSTPATDSENSDGSVPDKYSFSNGFGDGFGNPGIGFIGYCFKRAKGFFDVVCDTGTGSAHSITHNLGAAPQLKIRKARGAATQWEVWHSALLANEHLVLNSTAAKSTDATAWNSTLPTSTTFTVGTGANTNASGVSFVTYLFATLPGISKVGSYSGNGGTQTISCGFTTGSRFILIKRIDNTGDWFVWDTVRGITPTTDPHLSFNTTAAEVTTDDSIDQDASGFVVNQNAATNINALGGNYLFLAIA